MQTNETAAAENSQRAWNKIQDCPAPKISLSVQALQRRQKRYLLKEKHRFYAVCTPGFEPVLAEEIRLLPGAQIFHTERGGIEFYGPLELCVWANICLRSSNRVLLRITEFSAKAYPSLFQKIRTKSWELFLGINPCLHLSVSSKQSLLNSEQAIQDTLSDGIRDYYRAFGQTVSFSENSSLRLWVRFWNNLCTISMDTSGAELYKRGVKDWSSDAPIRETTAAALALRFMPKDTPVIVDPFCGSGTLLFEAAAILHQWFPIDSRPYAFTQLPFYQESWTSRCRKELSPLDSKCLFIGRDKEEHAVKTCGHNLSHYPFNNSFQFEQADALELHNAWGPKGFLFSNLPYGKRIQTEVDYKIFFRRFGNILRTNFTDWKALFIVPDPSLFSLMPLHMEAHLRFKNGGIPVFAGFGTISGTKQI